MPHDAAIEIAAKAPDVPNFIPLSLKRNGRM
jgi:hypothetical protein